MRALSLIAVLALVGCGKRGIDTSSPEKLEKSIEAQKQTLSPEKQKDYEKAIAVITTKDLDIENILQYAADPEGLKRKMADGQKALDGMSVEEVLAMGAKIEADRAAKKREQIAKEVKELEDKEAAVVAARRKLTAFKVERPRFYFGKLGFLKGQPTVELTVTNGMHSAVSYAYFECVLATPGRAVPWLKADLSHSISGGLEPGETATWTLQPWDGAWAGAPKDRKDMVLTVTVARLDGADGEPIIKGTEFSEFEIQRLVELKRQLAEMK